jgi:hypothetical protein
MKIKLNPFLEAVRGKMGDTVFRLCHTGEWQIASRPDMKKVKWSEAQKEHRIKFSFASKYGKYCMQVPELRAYYLKMAHQRGTNRPFDEAVRDFFQGNDKLSEWAAEKRRNGEVPTLSPTPRVRKKAAVNKQNRPQRAGFASSSSTKTAPASAGRPATMDDRWIVASLVISDSMYVGESIACCFDFANP